MVKSKQADHSNFVLNFEQVTAWWKFKMLSFLFFDAYFFAY